MKEPISKTEAALKEKLMFLQVMKGTAMGPAVMAGLGGTKSRGTRVVVCTDGIGTHGIGMFSKKS